MVDSAAAAVNDTRFGTMRLVCTSNELIRQQGFLPGCNWSFLTSHGSDARAHGWALAQRPGKIRLI